MDLTCPITSDKFIEPVVASDGHTYERKAIIQWFETSNISPCTGLRLQNLDVIPNYILLKIMDSETTRLQKMASLIDILWLYIKTLEKNEQIQIVEYAIYNIKQEYSPDFCGENLIKYVKKVYQFICDANLYCDIDKKKTLYDICLSCKIYEPCFSNKDCIKLLILFYIPRYSKPLYKYLLSIVMRFPHNEDILYKIICEIREEFKLDIKMFEDIIGCGIFKYKSLTYRIAHFGFKHTHWHPPKHITELCKEMELKSKYIKFGDYVHRSLRFAHIGLAEIDLYIKGKCHTLTCTNIQATILYHLSKYGRGNFDQLMRVMNIEATILATELVGIIKSDLIVNEIPISYTDVLQINLDYKGTFKKILRVPYGNYLKMTDEMFHKYRQLAFDCIKIRRGISFDDICKYVKCDEDILHFVLNRLIEGGYVEKTDNGLYKYLT